MDRIHYLRSDRPFTNLGLANMYNIGLLFVKTNSFECAACGKRNKVTKDISTLFEQLKDAHLDSLESGDSFRNRLRGKISVSGVLDDHSKRNIVIDQIMNDYPGHSIPRSWFDSYFEIIYKEEQKKRKYRDLLYK